MLSFFIAAAFLTVIACLAVLMPFLRKRQEGGAGVRDVDVYRAQLVEIDADLARGVIGAAEAAEARAELGRRILRASDTSAPAPSPVRTTRWAVLAAVAAVPLVSWGIYLKAGSPDLADRPLAARMQGDLAGNSVEELLARAERHLENNPGDGLGWSVIAPVYTRLGRFAEAAEAYRRAIAFAGEDSARLSGLAEALLAGGQGVPEEAEKALVRALALDPADDKSRFLMAVVHARKGEVAPARQIWQDLAGAEPSSQPWSELSRRALAEEAADAPDVPDADMIEGMVASLAARLQAEPGNAEGWERLVRSYVVLGRMDEARRALASGVEALAGSAEKVQSLRRLGAELGVKEEE